MTSSFQCVEVGSEQLALHGCLQWLLDSNACLRCVCGRVCLCGVPVMSCNVVLQQAGVGALLAPLILPSIAVYQCTEALLQRHMSGHYVLRSTALRQQAACLHVPHMQQCCSTCGKNWWLCSPQKLRELGKHGGSTGKEAAHQGGGP